MVNHAAKRGLVKSVDQMREIKEIRNEIVHEYIQEGLQKLFFDVLKHTPELMKIMQRTIDYANQIK